MQLHPETANLFELDPGLTLLLRGRRGEELRSNGRVVTFRLEQGAVDFDWLSRVRGWGLMVLEGFLTRHEQLAGRSTIELLGQGDVLKPWDERAAETQVPVTSSWRSAGASRVAVLDSRFASAVAPFPEVTEILASRLVMRSRASSLLLLVARLPWTEGRILVLFWHLAERWGRALPSGDVLLPLTLTYSEIGGLVSAQRPTVTMALNHLIGTGAIARVQEGWILHGSPPTPADLEREALAAAFRVRRRR